MVEVIGQGLIGNNNVNILQAANGKRKGLAYFGAVNKQTGLCRIFYHNVMDIFLGGRGGQLSVKTQAAHREEQEIGINTAERISRILANVGIGMV